MLDTQEIVRRSRPGVRISPGMNAAGGPARQWLWHGAELEPGLEEDLVMGERGQAPGSSGEKPGHDPDVLDEAREAALMREVLRTQEQHREGGVEPGLDEMDEDLRPGA